MVRQQFGVECLVEETGFQFDTSLRGDPSITLEYKSITPEHWTLTKEGTYRQVGNNAIAYIQCQITNFS